MKYLAIIAVVALALPHPAQAIENTDTGTGNQLLATCSADKSYYASGTCMGYILGVADAAGAMKYWCPAGGVTQGQVRDIVVNGLHSDVSHRQESSLDLIVKYLSVSFPCRK